MSSGISFSGLGSGLDTDSMISQLTQLKRRPITLMQGQQSKLGQKKELIQSINSSLLTLTDSVATLQQDDLFSIVQATSADTERVGVSATNDAGAGAFTVEVLALAQSRRLSSRSLGAISEALDLEGEFVINGTGVEIQSDDTLLDIRDRINAADAGVSAQILTVAANDNRLILSADEVGEEGFYLKDASSTNLLQALGFSSSETHLKNAFVNGARSAQFLAADESISSLLSLSSPPAGTITVGDQQISVDLNTDTLESLRDKITAAAPTDVTATVTSSDDGGLTRFRLEIAGTTDFVDDGGILEALGVFADGAVADEIVSGAESDAYSSTSTAIGTMLGLGSAPSGVVTIGGTQVDIDLAMDSLTAIQTKINDAAPGGVTATVISSTDEDGGALFQLRIAGSVDLVDNNNVLETLGVLEGSNNSFESVTQVLTGNVGNQQEGALLHGISDGAKTDAFANDLDPIQLLTGSTASGTVGVGDKTVTIDLATDSLGDIRDKINAAAPTGVTATINDLGGSYELQVDGTTAFTDDGGVLLALGVMEAPTQMTADTRLAEIVGADVQAGDTITIGGINHAGEQVAGTFTVSSTNLKIESLLHSIEQTFGNDVTASVDSSGRIVLADGTAGESALTLTLRANNEGGGTLDLGTMTVTTRGTNARSSELQAGQNAQFAVNGIMLSRDSNTITDAVQGVTLDLKQAEVGKIVDINVTRDDTTALRQNIESFVSDYNTTMSLINEQFVYDEATKSAGPLSGDVTLISLQSQLRSIMTTQIDGLDESFNALVLVGLTFDSEGKLSIDDALLTEALANNLDDVKNLFVAQGHATDKGIEYLSSGTDTEAGSYRVEITQAASRASVTGSAEFTGTLSAAQSLSLVDKATNQGVVIHLDEGSTLDDIIERINTEASSDVAEVRRGTIANTTDGSTPMTSSTTFASLFGAEVQDGDTIRINGTTHTGASVSRTFTVASAATDTVGDLLADIRSAFGGGVSASVDADGRIQITDNQLGQSELTITLIEENEGGGSLNFGSIDVEVEGRLGVEIMASKDASRLVLQHRGYGDNNGFTITEGLSELGLVSGEYLGTDVAGSINGEEADGFGRVLTGKSDNETTAGLSLRATLDQEELDQGGSERGTVDLVFGVARQLHSALMSITDKFDGVLKTRMDAIDDTIDTLSKRIEDTDRRVEQYRLNLVNKFAALEGTISTMQSEGNFLSQQLSGLSK